MKSLYYGDNLDVLRNNIPADSVDLCYIDPPFNSNRNYNQIYDSVGEADKAQAQAFIDTWTWNKRADEGFREILANESGKFTSQTVDLIKGLHIVLKKKDLLAYLVSMTLRINEIYRVLKPTGSFYLHCDPTASHYLKLVLDTIFIPRGGTYRNEIVWCYTGPGSPGMRQFMRKHDTIFWYTKSKEWQFNRDEVRVPHSQKTKENYKEGLVGSGFVEAEHKIHESGKVPEDWWEIAIAARGKEYLGYPTQKPKRLLERIIRANTQEGDVILDAYCGCGTTIAVAERLKRKWIGIDITYHSISLVLRRLQDEFGLEITDSIIMDGIPKDLESAKALAKKKDDRLRKEFEKWAILTYTNNRAIIHDKKGADEGIDGIAYFMTGVDENTKAVFQVKSGVIGRKDIAQFNSDRIREGAEIGFFITLQPPTKPMLQEAMQIGIYHHSLMGKDYPRIQIITIEGMINQNRRMDIPLSFEVIKRAKRIASDIEQQSLFEDE